MNPETKMAPCKVLTCLGIQVNLSEGTLKIDPGKLHSIHDSCLQVCEKKSVEIFPVSLW